MKAHEFQLLIQSGKIGFKKGKLVSNGELEDSPKPAKTPYQKKTKIKKIKEKKIPFSPKTHFDLLQQQSEIIELLRGEYHIDIVPIPKPRMTQRDSWKKRPVVMRYFSFVDEMKMKANLMGLSTLPMEIKQIRYVLPMPKSWPKKERAIMNNQPHLPKPDMDNLRKALQDAICKEDSHIARVHKEEKIWGDKGKIIIVI